uniref:Uncharacterized protein n=1 Tax=Prasinoderma singulare TaxID=676789 RepID=A0A7S3BMK3_9VIRI
MGGTIVRGAAAASSPSSPRLATPAASPAPLDAAEATEVLDILRSYQENLAEFSGAEARWQEERGELRRQRDAAVARERALLARHGAGQALAALEAPESGTHTPPSSPARLPPATSLQASPLASPQRQARLSPATMGASHRVAPSPLAASPIRRARSPRSPGPLTLASSPLWQRASRSGGGPAVEANAALALMHYSARATSPAAAVSATALDAIDQAAAACDWLETAAKTARGLLSP